MGEMDQRAFGALEAEVRHLRNDVAELRTQISEMREIMQQARGGWRLIMWLGGGAAAMGAAIGAKLAGWFST